MIVRTTLLLFVLAAAATTAFAQRGMLVVEQKNGTVQRYGYSGPPVGPKG